MGIILIDPFTDKRWDEFVLKHPEGTIFHHSSWARVLQDRYRTRPSYYATENSRGELTAIAPFFRIPGPFAGKRLVCLPSSEYCSPLADNSEDLEKLITKAKEEVQDNRLSYMEIRGFKGCIEPDKLFLKKASYYLSHVIPLETDTDKLRAKFERETRYGIKRAERGQVTIREGQNETDLKEFYRLITSMRRKKNLLPWPHRFFHSIYRQIILPGFGFFLLAESGGKVVSVGMFFCFKGIFMYEFSAVDPQFVELCPNYLLAWKAIERACEQSFNYFDFGRTTPENIGLIRFKRHWATKETGLPYYYYPFSPGMNSLHQNGLIYSINTIFNKFSPEPIRNIAGELFYKRMG